MINFVNWGINYYTIGAFIQFFFNLLIIINFLNRRDAKYTTKILGYFFVFFLPTNLSYFIASIFYIPYFAYYRWITVPSVFFSYSFLIYFFLIYKEKSDSKFLYKFKKSIFYLLLVFSSGITLLFYGKTFNAKIVYSFSGHNYEFFVPDVNKIIFNSLISVLIVMFISVIYKTIRLIYFHRKRVEKNYQLLLNSILLIWIMFITQLVPTITNILSVFGYMQRGFHYLIFVITIVVGFFITYVLYLNLEREETSLQYKISGISIVTILVLAQLISYFSLRDLENEFKELYKLKFENLLTFNGNYLENFEEKNQKSELPMLIYDKKQSKIIYNNKKLNKDIVNDLIKELKPTFQSQDILLMQLELNNIIFYFDYSLLRDYLHKRSKPFFYFVFVFTLLTSMIFPIFIKKEIIISIDELTNKIKLIEDKKDYNTIVKKYYNDELGFIVDTFNSMLKELKESYDSLKNYSFELEKKVEIRSKELKEQLEIISRLKEQQEGDYYLTSLLLKPLIRDKIDSKTLNIETFLKQSRIFNFRKKIGDIGGDNIILERVYFYQHEKKEVVPYIFFSISDAMGTSLQGAFGSIVYSVVLFWYLNTLKNDFNGENPLNIIQECYYLISKIFESFQGEMTCSSIIGLINELSGEFFYINIDFNNLLVLQKLKDGIIIETKENTDYILPPFGRNVSKNIKIHKTKLNYTEKIFFYSDGIQMIPLQRNNDVNLKLLIEEFDYHSKYLFEFLKKLVDIKDDISILSIERKYSNESNRLFSDIYNNLVIFSLYLIKHKQIDRFYNLITFLEKNSIIDAELFLSFAIYYYFKKEYVYTFTFIEYILKNDYINKLNKKNFEILINLYLKVCFNAKYKNKDFFTKNIEDYIKQHIGNSSEKKYKRYKKVVN